MAYNAIMRPGLVVASDSVDRWLVLSVLVKGVANILREHMTTGSPQALRGKVGWPCVDRTFFVILPT